MEHGSGRDDRIGGRALVDDQFAAAEAGICFWSGRQRSEEGVLGAVLLCETRLDGADIGVEGGNCGRLRVRLHADGNEGDNE